jgi:hypothetical protein
MMKAIVVLPALLVLAYGSMIETGDLLSMMNTMADPCGPDATKKVMWECAPEYVRKEIDEIRNSPNPDPEKIVAFLKNLTQLRPEHINPGMDCLAAKVPSVKTETDKVKANLRVLKPWVELGLKFYKFSQCKPLAGLSATMADPCLGTQAMGQHVMNSLPAHILEMIINIIDDPKADDIVELIHAVRDLTDADIKASLTTFAKAIPSLTDICDQIKADTKVPVLWVKLGIRVVKMANCTPSHAASIASKGDLSFMDAFKTMMSFIN